MPLACDTFQNLSESIKLIVNASGCYKNRPLTLHNFSDEELLQALRNFIEQRTAEAKSNLISHLSKQITVSYLEGAAAAADEVSYTEHIGMKGLDPVIESLAPRLDEAFGNLSGELTDIIDAGIWENKSYATIKKELQTALKGGWGNTITFDSVGKTRRYIHINPDGSLKWMEKTIQKTITLPTDTYAETLSRTHLKGAYAHGRQQTYIESGRKGWVYMSVADERTRPEHLALHGRVFIFGTEESDMALEVLKDYNCRCRQKAWFDDSKLDTDPEVYEKQRKEWAEKLFNEIKFDDHASLLSHANPQSQEDLNSLLPGLEKRMGSEKYKILGYQMGMSPKEMAKDTIKSLDDNFFYMKGRQEYSFRHIYRDHVIKDKSNGVSPFTLSEVISGKDSKISVLDKGKEYRLWKSSDGRRLKIVMSTDNKNKIVTAHRISEKDWNILTGDKS